MKTYDVYAIRDNKQYKMNMTPMTHKEACTFTSKFTARPETYYKLQGVTK